MERKEKHAIEVKRMFLREFEELIELCPQYQIAQLMITILERNRGRKDPYFYSNEQLLKRTELAKQSIEKDYIDGDYE